MAQRAAFAATPRYAVGQVATANTTRDGTGTGPATAIFTAGTNGSLIYEIDVQAIGTTTAGMVRLYIYNGTNARLFDEVPIAALTPAATQIAARASKTYSNLILPANTWSITASTHNGETFNIHVFAGDF